MEHAVQTDCGTVRSRLATFFPNGIWADAPPGHDDGEGGGEGGGGGEDGADPWRTDAAIKSVGEQELIGKELALGRGPTHVRGRARALLAVAAACLLRQQPLSLPLARDGRGS